MKEKENKLKYALFLLISIFSASIGFAQTTAAAPAASSSFSVEVNTILCAIAIILLFIVIVLAMTVNTAIEFYKQKKETGNNSSVLKNVTIFLGLILLSQVAFSQTAFSPDPATTAAAASKAAASTALWEGKLYFWGFITVIIAEVAIILFFIRTLRFLTGIDSFKKSRALEGKEKTIWETINQFKPLEEEDNMDTGHNYDGIRELDNITPPWFIAGFAATIIFAAIYLYRYEVAHSAPSEIEEYETSVHDAKILQDSLLKLEGNKVDENTVVMLGASDIDAGKKLFALNCVACHGDKGQGIVGPNLTDDYWLHGGSIHDVFKTIKNGWVEKGMKSWKDDFSPTQIAQLASFVKSLKGSNPPGAKEKQGELYVEEVAKAPNAKTDSTKTK